MRFNPLSAQVALTACVAISLYLLVQLQGLKGELADTTRRLHQVEAAVKYRESADPLVARECSELGLGTSREKPCQTTFRRLAQTPQRFYGSWIVVEGIYASSFEHTAVYPISSNSKVLSQDLDKHAALWVQLDLPPTNSRPIISVVGRFKRGPAGHLGDYFGELEDAKVLRHSEHGRR